MEKRYNHLNDYYQSIFGERVLKIPLDGGFSCPNRDGTKGFGGCIFCSERGSGDRLRHVSIEEQVNHHLSSFKGEKANKYIAYFQNYTNTYKPVAELRKIYNSAFIDKRIIGLDVATRCDCINEEVVELLSLYKDRYFVQVELGLQTANEKTHQDIHQMISNDEFVKAVQLLNQHHIDVVIHIMVGLPNETHEDIKNTIAFLNTLHYQGLKIHSTFVEKGTGLHELYLQGGYKPIEYEDYMEELLYILTHIRPDVVIHRITGDPYAPNFVAPSWMMHKKSVLNEIEKMMEKRNLYQGCEYNSSEAKEK